MATRTSSSDGADGCGGEQGQDLQPTVRSPGVLKQPHRGGYDCEFVERPPSGLVQTECPVCLLVLREPHQGTCCGYSYCQSCIERIQNTEKLCPTCNKEFTTFVDKRLKRSLNTLKVYCCHREEGCDWVGELLELDRHLNLQPPPEKLLVGCQFSEVECGYCMQPFQRRNVQAHLSGSCPKRPHTCQHCNKYAATFEEVMQGHWPVCPFFPLSCPNKCQLVLQRQGIESHVNQSCPLTLLQCDFYVVGCQAQIARRDMPSHISENLTGHMSLLQAHMMTHPGENVTTYMFLMVSSIQKIVLENASIKSELQEAQGALQSASHELQKTQDQLRKSHDELGKTQSAMTQLEKEVTAHSKTIAMHTDELQQSQHKVAQLQVSDKSQQEQRETLEQAINTCKKENTTLQLSLVKQKQELIETLTTSEHNLQATLAFQQSTITECRDENKRLQVSNTEQEKKQFESDQKLMTFKDDITHKITTFEQKIQAQESLLHQHQITLESMAYTGTLPFEFTMTEFNQHKEAGEECYSPLFHTHTHGYRMCIKVYANGNGSGKKTHLSVYGYLMRGDLDDDLQWPFQGAITVQLLNQLEDSNHHIRTFNFTGTTDPCIINRVTCGERAKSGWGNHMFISHAQLDFDTETNCQYLKDDQLKFRVVKANNLDPTDRLRRKCLKLESFAEAIEPRAYVVPIEFKLSDFERQKEENDVWYSPAFYTHPQGYRMCLKVYPNGNGGGLGTHVSVYTCVMQGHFDGGLKWPLQGEITIHIVNQAGDHHHEERVICYTDQLPESSSGRVTDGERSEGRGIHQFLSHTSLDYNAARNTQYLQGNSLWIRIFQVKLKN